MKKLSLFTFLCLYFFPLLAQTWKAIGPKANSSGTDYIEYQSGQVHSISYDPSDDEIFYASCPFGGLWKTINSTGAVPHPDQRVMLYSVVASATNHFD